MDDIFQDAIVLLVYVAVKFVLKVVLDSKEEQAYRGQDRMDEAWMDEAWTDWLIQCDMLQDEKGVAASIIAYNASICFLDRLNYLGGSRVGARRVMRIKSWSSTLSGLTHYSKLSSRRGSAYNYNIRKMSTCSSKSVTLVSSLNKRGGL